METPRTTMSGRPDRRGDRRQAPRAGQSTPHKLEPVGHHCGHRQPGVAPRRSPAFALPQCGAGQGRNLSGVWADVWRRCSECVEGRPRAALGYDLTAPLARSNTAQQPRSKRQSRFPASRNVPLMSVKRKYRQLLGGKKTPQATPHRTASSGPNQMTSVMSASTLRAAIQASHSTASKPRTRPSCQMYVRINPSPKSDPRPDAMSKISIRFPPRKGTINSACVAQFPIAVIGLQQTRAARPPDGSNAATNVHVVDFVGSCLDMRFHDISSCQSGTNRFQCRAARPTLAGRGHRGSAGAREFPQPRGRWRRTDTRLRHPARTRPHTTALPNVRNASWELSLAAPVNRLRRRDAGR
jgi:hypothetical protein